jgi:leucyl/phenylalanyl-tRNA--protein transferase
MTNQEDAAPRRRSITGQLLLMGHRLGVHPVPHGADGRSLRWVGPTKPAILPVPSIHVPSRVKSLLQDDGWAPTVVQDARPIIDACASVPPPPSPDWSEARTRGWVEEEILASQLELAEAGKIQAIACRRAGRLVAGLFGIPIGAVFFGEGMFARVRDAGDVALAELLGRLRAGGFRFVDLHFLSGHDAAVETLGHVRGRYRAPEAALEAKAEFPMSEQEFWPQALDDARVRAPRVA